MPPAVLASLLPVVLLVVLAAAMVLATRRPVNLRIALTEGALRIRFVGWDAVWLMQRDLVIAADDVRGVTVARLDQVPREGRKMPGANVPGVIRAGVWRTGTVRDLWDVRRAEHVLWIELEPNAGYRRLVLELPDPHATALELRPTLGSFVPELP